MAEEFRHLTRHGRMIKSRLSNPSRCIDEQEFAPTIRQIHAIPELRLIAHPLRFQAVSINLRLRACRRGCEARTQQNAEDRTDAVQTQAAEIRSQQGEHKIVFSDLRHETCKNTGPLGLKSYNGPPRTSNGETVCSPWMRTDATA